MGGLQANHRYMEPGNLETDFLHGSAPRDSLPLADHGSSMGPRLIRVDPMLVPRLPSLFILPPIGGFIPPSRVFRNNEEASWHRLVSG